MLETKLMDFDAIRLKLASSEEILAWSHGEVINYRTQKPEKDGLFDERIFGPTKDWECYCGKYRRIRYKGVICDKCGVEVTRSIVRRERMGHIQLASPVSHIWFLRGVPSKIGLILDVPMQELEKVIYFAGYLVLAVDEEAKKAALKEIDREYAAKVKEGKLPAEELKKARERARQELVELHRLRVLSEVEFHALSLKYAELFTAEAGGEAVKKALEAVDLNQLESELAREARAASPAGKRKILKRLKLVRGMEKAGVRPEWMFLTVLPVLPPDLRPMVQLDGGRYATSDLNDLYRRVINRNNRLKRLIELGAPEVICRNEKRMLQEAVDALIDNSARHGQGQVQAAAGAKRPLRSLADMIGPELKLHQCGLPKKMALELFKPFVINKVIERELAHNIRGASRLIEEAPDEVWAILEEVIQGRYVLLNRAPTLHRLGIQAFQPVLIEGFAIQIHPLVCTAFNADFDGDQMAVHLPLTEEAQEEAREIMLSAKNLLKPANGDPIVNPTNDVVLGCYWLTREMQGAKGEGMKFSSKNEAVLARQYGLVDLQAKISVLLRPDQRKNTEEKYLETTVGRILFNTTLPNDFPYQNHEMTKKALETVTGEVIQRYGIAGTGTILDRIKTIGFVYATESGLSWGMDDLVVPSEKEAILEEAEARVEEIRAQYERGLLTNEERRARVITVWEGVMQQITELVPKALDPNGSIYSIVTSRARGTWGQTTQMSGLKGLVVNPAGEKIELPIAHSYKEGLDVLEYFISTHGARKGTADTALRTASAGYLTRRLVDVAQDVVVVEADCGETEGIEMLRSDGAEISQPFASRIFGRTVAEDVADPKTKAPIAGKGKIIDREGARAIEAAEEIEAVRVRSPLSCRSRVGICQACYGYNLGSNQPISLGEAVGIVAAQAIGEPGTQLTMRTFHTGGVAGGGDITQGLPRVEEIFEARPPKARAAISDVHGAVEDIIDKGRLKVIRVKIDPTKPRIPLEETGEERETEEEPLASEGAPAGSEAPEGGGLSDIREFQIPAGNAVWVSKGEAVTPGQQLSEGSIDLRELFRISGIRATERHIINEVQKIYATEGAVISNKHIEVIVRQMFSRVRILDEGETELVPGDIVEKWRWLEENDKAKAEGRRPAKAAPVLMGITKVALSVESFLSAASFMETARVLIAAATEGREDKLRGLKENVIIGRLIPAGTGFHKSG
ncbi:DNA-directed RNA polymerase subunit beta' [Candidatus Azambacteria bacterium]|nr:DNA-directed RNA polymerase subunit beta' [Candidatus Azambacteria bacterium]